ncbi:coa transferase caib/baif family protein [Azorhizobium oxalatiphilum]|uniref:Coa transferase caib/baif family protein n=1 Tax=Azorhizobium oxalatiphilum TaxID=980631 RepID=A0A917CAF3_9HYPH|nr:CoA transferase [Azorhizobium oxalatiphilum]GGF81931.1 coa transferase caib/baif family protein [Azorhizobium oxalatiphilum]
MHAPAASPLPPPLASALSAIAEAFGTEEHWPSRLRLKGVGDLPSVFPVSDLACASIGAAGLALADYAAHDGPAPDVTIDRRLAGLWFSSSFRSEGWTPPPAWDAIAGDYRCADGWIRLHTNAPHHRAAALKVLETAEDRTAVAEAVARWPGTALESAIVNAGGCAAHMRSAEEWASHPQGRAVAEEPLIHHMDGALGTGALPTPDGILPLKGLRVLDLTRVLAGPTATRFLAGYGADVLRIDPPFWDEPSLLPDMTPGKRRARLDLTLSKDRARLIGLMEKADVMVHGYRSDALDRLGLSASERQNIRPGLVDVALDAYGWTGPWVQRRGFDSLVQMSTGIAEAGMRAAGADRPVPLPVQALDHATGYVLATAALRGLALRRCHGLGSIWRTSLARVATLLLSLPKSSTSLEVEPIKFEDFGSDIESTTWGPLRRLRSPLQAPGYSMTFERAAGPLGDAQAEW